MITLSLPIRGHFNDLVAHLIRLMSIIKSSLLFLKLRCPDNYVENLQLPYQAKRRI